MLRANAGAGNEAMSARGLLVLCAIVMQCPKNPRRIARDVRKGSGRSRTPDQAANAYPTLHGRLAPPQRVTGSSSSARMISNPTLSAPAKFRFSSSLKTRSRKRVADSVSMRLKGAVPGSSPARKSVRNTITGFFRLAYPDSQQVPESGSGPSMLGTTTSAQSTPSTSFSKICLADMDRCLDFWVGLPGKMVLVDAGYGHDSKLRAGITELGRTYVAGIQPQTLVWKPGVRPGRAPKKGRRDAPNTTSVKDLAIGLRARAWRTIKWREGTNEWLSSRFARVRVHVASRHERSGKSSKEWLLIEWPEGEDAPTKDWLSTLSTNITFHDFGDAAKLRWRIERDYEELKQEVGLGHYEGRGWRGFHHHATMCIAAYGFLVSERETIPPSGPRPAARLPQLAVPDSYRPRGSPIAA